MQEYLSPVSSPLRQRPSVLAPLRHPVTSISNFLHPATSSYRNLIISDDSFSIPIHLSLRLEGGDSWRIGLKSIGRPVLDGSGLVSHEKAEEKAEKEFEEYRKKEMKELVSDFDKEIKRLKEEKNN